MGVTVQNEPKATQTWDSCTYTAEEERDFVKHHLGPTLEREGLGDVRILVWDHNKERLYERASTVLADPEAARYVWGVACHWYSGDHFEAVALVRERFPGKQVLFTEGRTGRHSFGDWGVGERYAHDIIGDLNAGACGWIDWNMVLDERGGPNHVKNFCNAPVIAETRTGEIRFESSYWHTGHFSRFIAPGARRIGFSRYTDTIEVTAALNPSGEVVVVMLNRTDAERPVGLRCGGGIASTELPGRSIMTAVFRPPADGGS